MTSGFLNERTTISSASLRFAKLIAYFSARKELSDPSIAEFPDPKRDHDSYENEPYQNKCDERPDAGKSDSRTA